MDDANPLGALLASLSASHPMPAQVGDSQVKRHMPHLSERAVACMSAPHPECGGAVPKACLGAAVTLFPECCSS